MSGASFCRRMPAAHSSSVRSPCTGLSAATAMPSMTPMRGQTPSRVVTRKGPLPEGAAMTCASSCLSVGWG
ncbi:hypothetical protein ACN28S_09005 [Cystobacter fuscus]